MSIYISGKSCHTGTITVFTDPKTKLEIKGGGKWKDLELLKNHLIIDCGADIAKIITVYGFTPHIDLEKKYNHKSIIINWPDFDYPELDCDFWFDLIEVIRHRKKNIIVCCKGGHGRTGTCLTILAYYMDVKEAQENPIEFVRNNYCKEAVESESQVAYIEKICNLDLRMTHGSNWKDPKTVEKEKKETPSMTVDEKGYYYPKPYGSYWE